jgi:hypothetical protein
VHNSADDDLLAAASRLVRGVVCVLVIVAVTPRRVRAGVCTVGCASTARSLARPAE